MRFLVLGELGVSFGILFGSCSRGWDLLCGARRRHVSLGCDCWAETEFRVLIGMHCIEGSACSAREAERGLWRLGFEGQVVRCNAYEY